MAGTDLRKHLEAGRQLVGTFSLIPCIEIIELIAVAGFDFVIVDMEHGPYDLGSVRTATVAAQATGIPAVVRVRAPDPDLIGAVLDTGCAGVLAPHVSSARQAQAVLRAARFGPDGSRGANPYVRAAGYGNTADWFAAANRDVTVMVMIEGSDGINACAEILELPGLDAVFLGPVDLSHAMGLPGQPGHPEVVAALARISTQAADRGMATGVFAQDAQAARSWARRGVQLIARGADTDLIRAGFASVAAESRVPAADLANLDGTAVVR